MDYGKHCHNVNLTLSRISTILTSTLSPPSLSSQNWTNEFFSGLDEDKFEAVKNIFLYAKHIMWLTETAWVENPHLAISLLQSVELEYDDVHTQLLDIDDAEQLDTTFMAEQLLHLEDGSNW